jgi:hypothetical protein
MHTIQYLAPRREAVITGEKEVLESVPIVRKGQELVMKPVKRLIHTYSTQPWTLAGVMRAIKAGCVFGTSGQHDFAPGVAEFAANARLVWTELVEVRGDRHAA